LAKVVIILSGISLPVLYALNGTSFTLPLIIFTLLFFLMREYEQSPSKMKMAYTILILLFILAITLWHPSTSIVLPLIFISAGGLAIFDPGKKTFFKNTATIAFLGILAIVGTLTYWMYEAQFVWFQFLKNFGLAVQPELTQDLIPTRLFEINLFDQVLIGLSYHARDLVLIFFATLGFLLIIIKHRQDANNRLLRTNALIWLMFAFLVVGIFAMGFGAQGYRRFMI
jgi:hypothetical protein